MDSSWLATEGDEEDFEAATQFVRSSTASFSPENLLYFYARYKQATEGPCNIPKPGFLDFQGKKKWEAWNSMKTSSKQDAMTEYVNYLSSIVHGWREKKVQSTNRVSTMRVSDEIDIPAASKTAFDWLKEGKVDIVMDMLAASPKLISSTDCEGQTLLHWAADRGFEDLCSRLLSLNSDVNATDNEGLTPLHCACANDHLKIVTLLLKSGALTNSWEIHPSELTSSSQVLKLLEQNS